MMFVIKQSYIQLFDRALSPSIVYCIVFTYELVLSLTKLVTVQPFPFFVLCAGGLSGDVKNYLFQKQVISPCQKIQEAL